MESIKKSLRELGFDANETKVYMSLTQLGESKASLIAKKAGLNRTTTISILERLSENGFVTTHRYKGTTFYWVESPKVIENVFENKAKIAHSLSEWLSDLYRSDAAFPYANVCDTKKSVKNFTEKALSSLPKGCTIYTIDSPNQGNYDKVIDSEFLPIIYSIKEKRAITTKTLVPFGTYSEVKPNKLQNQKIVVKELPEGLDFNASVWFMNDLLVLFSGKPPFIVYMRHPAIVASLKGIFDFLWVMSKNTKK